MGRRQPSSLSDNAQNVPACSSQRVERGGRDSLPRLPAEVASAEPRGGHTHHSAGGPRNFQRRSAGAILGGLKTS